MVGINVLHPQPTKLKPITATITFAEFVLVTIEDRNIARHPTIRRIPDRKTNLCLPILALILSHKSLPVPIKIIKKVYPKVDATPLTDKTLEK